MTFKVYIASSTRYAKRWRTVRDEKSWNGVTINSRWIDETDLGREDTLTEVYLAAAWQRNMEDIAHANLLVCYTEGDGAFRGALIEIGAALSWETPVIICGPGVGDPMSSLWGSWQFHPLVTRTSQFSALVHEVEKAAALG